MASDPKWKLPFPEDQLEVRVICGDPIAIAYNNLVEWLSYQPFKPKISIEELIDCLWWNKYGGSNTRYHINRSNLIIPQDIPDNLYYSIDQMFEDTEYYV